MALPLLLLGSFRLPLMLLLWLPLTAVALRTVLRRLPALAGPRWALAALLCVCAGVTALLAVTHSEHTVIRRDAGSYAAIAAQYAANGTPFVDTQPERFGGPHPMLRFASPAFYETDDPSRLTPQFMAGPPAVYAIGEWVAGPRGVLLIAPLLGGLAVLAVGGLAARLIGVPWAWLASLAFGAAYPVLHTARTTLSEPLAVLLLATGLALLVDALRTPPGRALATAAGAVLGLDALVRIDAFRDVIPLIAVAGVLAAQRRPQALPLFAGIVVGSLAAVADLLVIARPYASELADSLVPVAVLAAAVLLSVAVLVPLARLGRLPQLPLRLRAAIPTAGAAIVVLGGVLLALRPLVIVGEAPLGSESIPPVRALQQRQGLPVDGSRSYAEYSVEWLSWWVGWPLLVLALAGAAVLVRATLGGPAKPQWLSSVAPGWGPVLAVLLWAAATTLLRPGITPDHPWADRRLVPVVLPAVVLCAVWLLSRLVLPARDRTNWPVTVLVAALGAVVLLLPAVLASGSLIGQRTEVGEVAAVERACAWFRDGDVALLVDDRTHNEWTQVLRSRCNVPVANVEVRSPAVVAAAAARARAAGSTPVVLGYDAKELTEVTTATPVPVVDVATRQDQRLLVERPTGTAGLHVSLWAARL